MTVKVFNLMLGEKEKRFLVQHQSDKCKCGLNKCVCNWKKKRNQDKHRRNCKELDDWNSCEDSYIWNPSACYFEYNKTCKIGEYLDSRNC